MSEQLFTVEQVAQSLSLHVRTIRNYVRAGRLKATRIGKQYRIARSDLQAFTGAAGATSAMRIGGIHSGLQATSVVQIEAISQDSATHLTQLLLGAAKARRPDPGCLQVSTAYDESRDCLRVVIVSTDLRATTDLMGMIAAVAGK